MSVLANNALKLNKIQYNNIGAVGARFTLDSLVPLI